MSRYLLFLFSFQAFLLISLVLIFFFSFVSCFWSWVLFLDCWIEEHVPERLGPQVPGWAAQENGKETLMGTRVGSICCSSVRSPTPSYTQPFQIKWEVYFSKSCVARLYCVVVFSMNLHMSYNTRPHFLSGVFIMTSKIVTSTLHAREHLHSMSAPN